MIDLTEDSDDDVTVVLSEELSDHTEDTDDDLDNFFDTPKIFDLTEDSDDDVTMVLSEELSDHTEDTDDDLDNFTDSAPDLSEIIDDDTLKEVQRNVNKALGAKAKRDDLKVPTKNDIRVKKNLDAKKKYHKMSKQAKFKLNAIKCTKQREVRAEINKDLSTKREKLDKRNKMRKKAEECKRFALKHNILYPSNADMLEVSQRKKSGKLLLGRVCKTTFDLPDRLQTFASGIPFIHEPLGAVTGEGYYQTITPGSRLKLFNAMLKWIPIEKIRYLITLDLGSGLSLPSIFFSQYITEFGMHFGIESQAGLVHSARCNIHQLTKKGLNNIHQEHLSPPNIKENGELKYNVPPNCVSVQGKIEDVPDLSNFDLIHGFDEVNSPETFDHLAMIWNNPKSKMCKFFITNLNSLDIADLGFKDIVCKEEFRCQLSGIVGASESRKFYFFMRKSISTMAKKKWKFENDNQVATASGPFKEAWERFHKGRLQPKTGYYFNPEIAKMNMEYDIENYSTNKEGRSTKTTKAPSYNEEKLIESQWKTARKYG